MKKQICIITAVSTSMLLLAGCGTNRNEGEYEDFIASNSDDKTVQVYEENVTTDTTKVENTTSESVTAVVVKTEVLDVETTTTDKDVNELDSKTDVAETTTTNQAMYVADGKMNVAETTATSKANDVASEETYTTQYASSNSAEEYTKVNIANNNSYSAYGSSYGSEYSDGGQYENYGYDSYTNYAGAYNSNYSEYNSYYGDYSNDYSNGDYWNYSSDGVYEYAPNDEYASYGDSNEYYDDGKVYSSSVTLYTTGAGADSWANIQRAAQLFNGSNGGYILAPGAYFSWFNVMGPCNETQGFIAAPAYAIDEYGNTYVYYVSGGGICFTSTTLMQGVRAAGCVITEKHDHSMPVSYAMPGNEASVSYGTWDLSFYNPSTTTSLFITMEASYWGTCKVTCTPIY